MKHRGTYYKRLYSSKDGNILKRSATCCNLCGMKTDELIALSQAMNLLRVSRTKIWRLVKEGQLDAIVNPLDKREKLFSKSQVESLIPKRAEAA
jgi:predicted DNA-binding transcriptional regulator AlpA